MDGNWNENKAEGVVNYTTKKWESKVEVTYLEGDNKKKMDASDYNKKKE